MSDLAPFVAANLRDKTISDLLAENAELKKAKKENVRDLKELLDAYSQHAGSGVLEFVALTGPGGSPLYSTAVPQVLWRNTELEDYDNGSFCWNIDNLFDTEVRINNKVAFCVSEADRIVCTRIHRDFQGDGSDLIDLVISFGRVHLTVMFRIPRIELHLWTDLDIVPSENPEQVVALRNTELVEDEEVHFAFVRFADYE